MTSPTKMTLAVAILVIGMVSNASASTHGVSTYYDTIRPHGYARSDAVYNGAVNACYNSSGESRTAVNDTPTFKKCMLSFGYRFENTQVVQDAPSATARSSVAQRSYSGSSVTISIGGGDDDEAASTAAENNDWAAQQEQSAMDAANAGYAQDAATAAANVAAAATFDAQMTVGN